MGLEPKIKKFECTHPNCKAKYSRNSKLLVHMRTHTGERPFVCDEPNCSKSYTNNSHLRRHKDVTHNNKKSEKSIICEYENCGLVLANKYSYKKHYNAKHNPDKNKYAFKCGECMEGFKKKKQLQQHSYTHTGIAPFKCDVCDISCTTIIAMTKHKKRHKTYKCQSCDEVFYRWTLLTAHRRETCPKIERKTTFPCPKCKKNFTKSSNLKIHIKTHNIKEEKYVYPCPFNKCKRFYFYKKNLMIHINWFHKQLHVQNNKCTYPNCEKILKTKITLKRHLLQHITINKRKIKRKSRLDKGKPKKCMASILTGKEIPLELHQNIIINNGQGQRQEQEQSQQNKENTCEN